MPVIVPGADWSRWLGFVDPAQPATDLLRPHPSDEMTAWKLRMLGAFGTLGQSCSNHASLAQIQPGHCLVKLFEIIPERREKPYPMQSEQRIGLWLFLPVMIVMVVMSVVVVRLIMSHSDNDLC